MNGPRLWIARNHKLPAHGQTRAGFRDFKRSRKEAVMAGPPNHDVYTEYRKYLIILAKAQISFDRRGQIDPSDLVQQTLLDAAKDPTILHSRTRPEMMSWLRRILRDNFFDRLRRLKLEAQVVPLDHLFEKTSHGLSSILPGSESGPDARIMRAEDALIVAELLRKLPDAQAEAIVLKHCEGMSVKEISRHMNKTPAAVGGLLRHGMRKLRELMPQES
jgi:RNA polymerase sigma-70 factor, ECF subfamily